MPTGVPAGWPAGAPVGAPILPDDPEGVTARLSGPGASNAILSALPPALMTAATVPLASSGALSKVTLVLSGLTVPVTWDLVQS